MSAPSGDNDRTCRSSGIKAQACAGGDGQRREYINRADGGAGQRGQNAGQNTEDKDHDKRIDVGSQHICHGGTYQVCKTGVAQRVGHADDACGHEDNGCADCVTDFFEVHHADHQKHSHRQACDRIARISDGALENHADDGDDEYHISHLLLLLGKGGCGVPLCQRIIGCCSNGMVRQELVLNQAVQQEAHGKGEVHYGEFGHGYIGENACAV